MIDSIIIRDVATYRGAAQRMDSLSQFNFVYGANGTGKTSISRVIADASSYPSCGLSWQRDRPMQTLVYNGDFVEKNFVQSAELKGVFTLGEEQVGIQREIEAKKQEVEEAARAIEAVQAALSADPGSSGKRAELENLEDEIKGKCWAQKKKHDDVFADAFAGLRHSQEKFKERVFEVRQREAVGPTSLADLEARASSLFGSPPELVAAVPDVDASKLTRLGDAEILSRAIVGRGDIDFGELVQRLGNSDWVQMGRQYLEKSQGACPFCQQSVGDDLVRTLDEYFDTSYREGLDALTRLDEAYKIAAETVLRDIDTITSDAPRFLDTETLLGHRKRLAAILKLNAERIAAKVKEPSRRAALDSITEVHEGISALVAKANTEVKKHNDMVANLAETRRRLVREVWDHIVRVELADDLKKYDQQRETIGRAIDKLEKRLAELRGERAARQRELQALERKTTSTQPTIDAINALLQSMGFTSFSLANTDEGHSYRLVRADGTDAKETLSEGERSFVTFLYFYHLLNGSNSESGVTADRVVVFDDPVSSLDSDVLFIVSGLIRKTCQDVRAKVGAVRQVFVMTHKVYFHREVTFNTRRRDHALKEETFWVVRRTDEGSEIEGCETNPIGTAYELLWDEVRNPHRTVTIQNALRRIIENYFKILGRVDPEDIIEMFEGRDRVICRSLFSWVNAGSHFAFDDLYVASSDGVANYLRVFREVFEKTNHGQHYKMMMRIQPEAEDQSESPEGVGDAVA